MRKEALQGLLSGNYLNVSTARQRCLALTHLRLTVFNLFEKIIKKSFKDITLFFFLYPRTRAVSLYFKEILVDLSW